MTPQLTTFMDADEDLQRPFDVAVVIPTCLEENLATALRSVFQQDLKGRVQILVGIDNPEGDLNVLHDVLQERPAHMAITVLWPGYSTNRRHGGLWASKGGGSLRTILSFLANSRHIAYLDEDHWYSPEHLRMMLGALKGKAWAFSRRWFVDTETSASPCVDSWESVGPNEGAFAAKFGGYVNTNCMTLDKIQATTALSAWSHPLSSRGNGNEDRTVLNMLKSIEENPGDTGVPSVFSPVKPNDENAELRHKLMAQHQKTTDEETFKRPKKQVPPPRTTVQTGSLHTSNKVEKPYDIAVIIPTTLRDSLIAAVQSVYRQKFQGRIQVLIGVDGAADPQAIIETLETNRPAHVDLLVFAPGYSTSQRHGGVHEAYDGGSLRSLLSFLAHASNIAYLDDDNVWQDHHLSDLSLSIMGFHYAFSLRTFIHPDGETAIGVDKWESLGPKKGFYAQKFNGFSDPNCLMVDMQSTFNVMPLWTKPLPRDKEAMSADRHVFKALAKYAKGKGTGKASVNYQLCATDPMHALRSMYLGHHWINADMAALRKRLIKKIAN